ncbi:MAG: hypothetical protein IIT46_10205 [Lachnospiraceae bacterium]|nr:hypothetical protein [Lachnospiraceae bacterium]MBQ5560129.1 hypothetical protein [Lachnospiraceae bacterium]
MELIAAQYRGRARVLQGKLVVYFNKRYNSDLYPDKRNGFFKKLLSITIKTRYLLFVKLHAMMLTCQSSLAEKNKMSIAIKPSK